MLPSVGGSAEKAPSVLLRHASLPSKKRSWPDEPPRDKARPWVEAEKGKRGQGRVGPLRRMGRAWRSLTFDARKMLLFIVLDLAYLLVEMGYGLAVNNMALVSDAFHMGFGCCVLGVSLVATIYARHPPDDQFSYGYDRGEVLAAFTNAAFLLFEAFSTCVEALHTLIEPPEERNHHHLVVVAVTSLLVNLLGVLTFRKYAHLNITYRTSQDMNLHAIFLHVAADSIRGGGTMLALYLTAINIKYAEALVCVLEAAAVLFITLPVFYASSRILLQGVPEAVERVALNKCLRDATAIDGVLNCHAPRFWALHPGALVGTLRVRVAAAADEQKVLREVHAVFDSALGCSNLTVQVEKDSA